MRRYLFFISVLMLIAGCRNDNSSDIIVFHAGSLTRPFNILAAEYEAANPDVSILLEPAGSLVSARKITELNKPADIMASADYIIIDEMLTPEYSSWNLGFSTNEMVIAYKESSRYSDIIDSSNWFKILLREDVFYGRADPDSDPCGYRSIFTMKLAEIHYGVDNIAERLIAKSSRFVRPKSIDLIALLETGSLDYLFAYKSVAVQNDLRYLTLPDPMNLGDIDSRNLYNMVSFDVPGDSPSKRITITGDYIVYGITLLNDAPNRDAAISFLAFVTGPRGREVFIQAGHNILTPYPFSGSKDSLPPLINDVLLKEGNNGGS